MGRLNGSLAGRLIESAGRGRFGARFGEFVAPQSAASQDDRLAAPAWEYECRHDLFEIFRRRTPADLAGKRVLDLGSGYGGRTVFYAESAASATGLEPYDAAVDVSREFAAERGVDTAFVVGRGEEMPFPDASFDVVVSFDVLEHVQDPRLVVAEIARVLAPGGEAWLIFPSYLGARASHLDPLTRLPGLHRLFAPHKLAAVANAAAERRGIGSRFHPAAGPFGRVTVSDTLNGMSVADARNVFAGEPRIDWKVEIEPLIEPRTRLPGGRPISRMLALAGRHSLLPDLLVGRLIVTGVRTDTQSANGQRETR